MSSTSHPVAPTARPYRGGTGSIGVVMSHGFTGSVQSILPWAQALAQPADGWDGARVVAPRLPGHGTSWRDLARTRWWDWYQAIDDAYEEVADECEKVFVAGLSMGGALALRLASLRPVAGVLLVNPAIASKNKVIPIASRLHRILPSQPGIASDIADPDASEVGYPRFSVTSLATMTKLWKDTRSRLGKIQAPALLMRSVEDHVVDGATAAILQRKLRDLTVVDLPRSFHVATLDYDAPTIVAESRRFIQDVVSR